MFDNKLAAKSMTLSFIPPSKLVAKLKVKEVRKVEDNWKYSIMLFTPDVGIKVPNVQWFGKTMWPNIHPKRIIAS